MPTRRSPRPYTNRRGVLRREELYYALDLVLGEHGWDGLTIRRIAEQASVSVGLVHHHFAGRADLARALFEIAVQGITSCVSRLEPGELAALFRQFVAVSIREAERIGDAWFLAFVQATRSRRPLPTLARTCENLLEKASDVPPTRPEVLGWYVETAHRALLERYLVERDLSKVLASADRCSGHLVRLANGLGWDEPGAELAFELRRHLGQRAGTRWHDESLRAWVVAGAPTRNSRRSPRESR